MAKEINFYQGYIYSKLPIGKEVKIMDTNLASGQANQLRECTVHSYGRDVINFKVAGADRYTISLSQVRGMLLRGYILDENNEFIVIPDFSDTDLFSPDIFVEYQE